MNGIGEVELHYQLIFDLFNTIITKFGVRVFNIEKFSYIMSHSTKSFLLFGGTFNISDFVFFVYQNRVGGK